MFSMRMEGGDELAAAFDTLSTRLTKTIVRNALMEAAEPTQAGASRRAPRAPGLPDIADNIGISPARTKGDTASDIAAVAVGPTKGFFYGLYLEYGTVKMSARSFMRPAFDSDTPQGLQIFADAAWRALAARGNIRTASVETPVSGPGSSLL